jgi:hypothetical protein
VALDETFENCREIIQQFVVSVQVPIEFNILSRKQINEIKNLIYVAHFSF